MNNGFASYLAEAFKKNNLAAPSEEQAELFEDYMLEMLWVNKNSFNLTAICDLAGVVYKHFTDCAAVIKHIPKNARLIDVGSGAGLPAVPIAILRPDVKVTALDSTAKKMGFVARMADEFELRNLKTVVGRAEELARAGEQMRESFDVAVARAVAVLPVLTELCMPFVKVGGRFIAMKSGKEDTASGEGAITKTGGEIAETDDSILHTPTEDCTRKLIVVNKIKPTPSDYPRKNAEIMRKPLS